VRVGRVPYWSAVSASRRRRVTSPGVAPEIVNSPSADFTEPTGVITAAVPQANTSVSSPDAAFFSTPRGDPALLDRIAEVIGRSSRDIRVIAG